MSVTLDLSDRIAVVTGAASGIGRAIAFRLADAGATIVAVDRNESGVRETVEELGGASTSHVADLTDPAAIAGLRDEVVRAHRVPDVPQCRRMGSDRAVHGQRRPVVAGPDGDQPARSRARQPRVSEADHRRRNAGQNRQHRERCGPRRQHRRDGLRRYQRRRDRVHEVSRPRGRAAPDQRQLRLSGTDRHPLLDTMPDRLREGLEKAIPFRRLARPQEIADAVVFFTSDRAGYITGQVLSVSGGLTMAG